MTDCSKDALASRMADVIHHDPPTLPKSPAYSQGVSVGPNCRTVFIGGQTGVRPDGSVIGNDVMTQAEQALRNVGPSSRTPVDAWTT